MSQSDTKSHKNLSEVQDCNSKSSQPGEGFDKASRWRPIISNESTTTWSELSGPDPPQWFVACLSLCSHVSAQYNASILPYWPKTHYNAKHIRLYARSFPRGSYKESIDKLVVLLVSYKRESQRLYYIIMHHCHLLHCWWPLMGQVSTGHTCLYKQIKVLTANTVVQYVPLYNAWYYSVWI